MSLQVWLPLNGDLRNYGLSDVQVTNNGATIDNNGKIGKCYSFNGSSNWIQISKPSKLTSIKNCSICFWVKSTSSTVALGGISHDGNSSSLAGLTMMGNSWQVSGNSSNWKYVNGGTVANTSIWHHVCCTIDDNIITTYLDGSVVTTSSLSSLGITTTELTSSNFLEIGCDHPGGNEFFTGLINDFRVYDHALSVKEVKEIAKGLVLHYPLNCNGIGIPNLVDNSATFSGWTAGSGWTLGEIDRIKTYSFSRTGATSNNWVRLIPTLQVNGNDYPNGITVSMDIYTPDKSAINQRCFGSLQTYQASGSRIGWVEPWWDVSKIINNQWCRISYTFTQAQLLNNCTSGTTYAYTKFSFQLVQNGNISIRKIKIEEGNKATTWIPNEFDPLYAAAGYASGIVYDCSGYQNNGIKVGTITGSSDTPRYRSSSNFPSGTNYINAGRGAMVTDAITINLWIKCSTWGNVISCTEGGGWNFEEYNGGIRFPVYTTDNVYQVAQSTITSASLKNNWHMLTGTYNGLIAKIYIDGEEKGSITCSTTHKDIKYNVSNVIFIGAEASGNANTPASTAFIGSISDVRIYCTALSADDIKALYNDAGYVDKNGNFHAYEFVEG